jgi:hypothetical protein
MPPTLWLFGTRLTILADHTTTGGQYDLIEGYFPSGTQTPLHRHTHYSEEPLCAGRGVHSLGR